MANSSKNDVRVRVHQRIRHRVHGTQERPRLAVFRSARHISVQVIDDATGRTLASAATVEKAVREAGGTGNMSAAASVGRLVAERARAAGVSQVVFDRGGFLYHGRIAALADAAREAGLEF